MNERPTSTSGNPAEDWLARWRSAQNVRGNFDNHWQELAEVLLPKRADFTNTPTIGDRRTVEILDGTPMQARRQMAAAMHAMLFPTHTRWFNIKPMDDELEDDDSVGAWLDDTEKRMWAAIYDPAAQFAAASGEAIDDLITFGTAVVMAGTNQAADRLLFTSYHLKDAWLAESHEREIDTLFLKRNLTARQARQMGYDSEKIKEALDRNTPETVCSYLHVIAPRHDRNPQRRDNKMMPYAHIILDIEEKKVVEESGFEEFPFACPRWETAAEEVYGRSPAMMALPDIRTLMEMRRTTLAAAQKAVDPPIAMPSNTAVGADSFFPGGTMVYNPQELQGLGGARNAIYPVMSGAEIGLGLEMENQTREMIWNAFFRDSIRLPTDGPQMTATEILQRREEFMRTVGPVFGRQEHDFAGKIVTRVFGIMMRKGAFAPPPDVLNGRSVQFEFKSAVQQAQKRIEVAATMATLEQVLPLVPYRPEIMDNFDADQIARDIADSNGMPHKQLAGRDKVEQIRQGRAQQAAAQAALATGSQIAEAGGKVAPLIQAAQQAA